VKGDILRARDISRSWFMSWVEFETKDHTFQRMVRPGSELLQICGRLRILNSKNASAAPAAYQLADDAIGGNF